MPKSYRYVDNFRGAVPAQAFGEAMDAAQDATGRLEPQSLVDMAEPETSPLHALFSWDDKKEANFYRLNVSRKYIRATREVQVVVDLERPKAAPEIIVVGERVHSRRGPETGYYQLETVASDPELLGVALHELGTRLAAIADTIRRVETAARREAPDKAAGVLALSRAFRLVEKTLAGLLH